MATQQQAIATQLKLPARFGQSIEQFWPASGTILPGAMNFDTTQEGKLIPAYDSRLMTGTTDLLRAPQFHVETQNPSGNPRTYISASGSIYRLEDGTLTLDTTFSGVVVRGMVICDGGGVGGTAAGTPVLLVGFGQGTASVTCAWRLLTTDTNPWTTVVRGSGSTAGAQFGCIVKSGRDLYAVSNGGDFAITTYTPPNGGPSYVRPAEYHVSLLPAGNNPTLRVNWGGGVSVGTPEWPVVKLAPIDNQVAAGKADGLWYYDDQTKRYTNELQFLEKLPNMLNGQSMEAIQNGIAYDTHDGRLFFFDGNGSEEITPWKGEQLSRDVRASRFSAIADNGDYLALATACFQHTAQSGSGDELNTATLGLAVLTKINGSILDVTPTVTDGLLSNGASMSNWGAVAGDAFYIGANVPFEAAVLRTTAQPNSASVKFAAPQYSTAADTFTALSTGIDGTSYGSTAATQSLMLNTIPPELSAPVLTWTPSLTTLNSQTAWQAVAMGTELGGAYASPAKYWMKWTATASGTGMSTGTRIDDVSIVPSRAKMPGPIPVTAQPNWDLTPRDRAGGCTHIYMGKRTGASGFVWHDTYALNMGGAVTALGWHSGLPGALGNGGQVLCVWGRYQQILILDGVSRDPSRTVVPKLQTYVSNECGPLFPFTPSDLGEPTALKRLNKVIWDGNFIQPTDGIFLYGSWDNMMDIFCIGIFHGAPGWCEVPPEFGRGRVLRLWLGFNDASQKDITAPYITGLWAEYDTVNEEDPWPRDPAFPTGQEAA